MVNSIAEVKSIFAKAVEIASSVDRQAYLEQACGGDATLRADVESLLAAHDSARGFFGDLVPTQAATPRSYELSERPGTVIGPYRLLEQIGEGGFGVVFMAEQTAPVKRKVALKLLKPGMDTHQVIARFEAERQALALMDHPNIAKVLDGGATPSGRPFFVMELVRGIPITNYWDQNRLTTRQRLELFLPVCHAVQHAHQKGIVHRDLKPSNVLVAVHDTTPVPKVIDFGVAKALGQELTEKTLFTSFAQMLGTPLYMSPEQAGQSSLDIDTRSDIYSLGVLLYELLTGTTPIDRERLKRAAYDEICKMIREEEPPKPSARLSQLGRSGEASLPGRSAGMPSSVSSLASVSALRQSEPAKLTKLVRGELDWIVMKCLEKDRQRRYETANDLAIEIQRYLADEPVLAGPPSRSYRLRKFVQRNKSTVLAISLVLLALIGGIVGTTIGLVRAQKARQAEALRAEGEKRARESAQKRLAQIEKGITTLTSVFERLDPRAEEKEGRPLRAILGDHLIRAAAELEGETVGDPLVVARLQVTLGKSLLNLSATEPGIQLLLKARQTLTAGLGSDHPDTLTSMNSLALGYKYAGKLQQARSLHEETLALRQSKLGPDHPDTLESMNNLAAAHRELGNPKAAIPLHAEALRLRQLKLGEKHPDTLVSMNNLALSYHVDGQMERAMPLYEEAYRLRKEVLGHDHTSTLTSLNNLALGYTVTGQIQKAIPLNEEVLRLRKATLGGEHPETLTSMSNLASNFRDSGMPDRALPLFEEIVRIQVMNLGKDHPDSLTGMNNLALTLHYDGKLERALPLFVETLELRKAKLGANHPQTMTTMSNLARTLNAVGRVDEATRLYEQTLEMTKAKLGVDHPNTFREMSNLASVYWSAGKQDRALPLSLAAATGMEKRQYRDANAVGIVRDLIFYLDRLNQLDQAEAWQRKLLPVVRENSGSDSAAYATELSQLGSVLVKAQRPVDAENALRESLALLRKLQPEALSTFHTMSLLGAALLGQQKYSDAEPLLLEGYTGLQQGEAKLSRKNQYQLSESLERLVQLYDAWDMKDKADEWRKKMADTKSNPPPQP